jgi:hypothetical protein
MDDKSSKWMFKAMFLGLVFFLSVLIIRPIGVSTQFSVLGGIIHSTADPSVITEDSSRKSGFSSKNAYYDRNDGALAEEIKHPLNYSMVFLFSIPLGGFIAWAFDPHKREKKAKVEYKERNQENLIVKWYIREFAGGFIFLFGARMADGCTSGHMMSGMMQSSVSGYIFALCAFAAAIPTAKALKKLG